MDENKQKALEQAINKIEKDFGKGAVMRLGDPNAMGSVEVVATGALSLDIGHRDGKARKHTCWNILIL